MKPLTEKLLNAAFNAAADYAVVCATSKKPRLIAEAKQKAAYAKGQLVQHINRLEQPAPDFDFSTGAMLAAAGKY